MPRPFPTSTSASTTTSTSTLHLHPPSTPFEALGMANTPPCRGYVSSMRPTPPPPPFSSHPHPLPPSRGSLRPLPPMPTSQPVNQAASMAAELTLATVFLSSVLYVCTSLWLFYPNPYTAPVRATGGGTYSVMRLSHHPLPRVGRTTTTPQLVRMTRGETHLG